MAEVGAELVQENADVAEVGVDVDGTDQTERQLWQWLSDGRSAGSSPNLHQMEGGKDGEDENWQVTGVRVLFVVAYVVECKRGELVGLPCLMSEGDGQE